MVQLYVARLYQVRRDGRGLSEQQMSATLALISLQAALSLQAAMHTQRLRPAAGTRGAAVSMKTGDISSPQGH